MRSVFNTAVKGRACTSRKPLLFRFNMENGLQGKPHTYKSHRGIVCGSRRNMSGKTVYVPRDDAEAKLCSMNSRLRGWISLLNTWSTSSAISARNARGHCVLSAAGGPLSKQEMPAPVCAAPERAQPLTLDVPTLASKGEPPQGSIELGPLPSEVGLTCRLRLRSLLRVGLFTIQSRKSASAACMQYEGRRRRRATSNESRGILRSAG